MAKAIATISRTKEIMEKHGLHTKKKFGQNFLTEPSIVTRIAQAVPMAEKRLLIEIGPGIGALTEQLALVADKVIAYEIDDDLIPVLADTLMLRSTLRPRLVVIWITPFEARLP